MDDSGAFLCEISLLKDMLDKVNEEIEANIQITREIESEMVKCDESEASLLARESELMKTAYMQQFEINGLKSVTANSTASHKLLEEELDSLRGKRDEIFTRMNVQREVFQRSCMDFQKNIGKQDNDEIGALLLEKACLEREVGSLNNRNSVLQNSMAAFVEEILEDLQNSIHALEIDIRIRDIEREKLTKEVDELKKTLLSTMSAG
ncbi:hypothetical protein DM860_017178 [Cuscuta australis]|uniref:Uncharacterized protein n=1 Tax=Cuscuta australis TaxID=267555 RepID=A0A328DXF6_9ASTE|nr:hypothetical protein DM860_017178 [Cuscuta australis]